MRFHANIQFVEDYSPKYEKIQKKKPIQKTECNVAATVMQPIPMNIVNIPLSYIKIPGGLALQILVTSPPSF